MLTWPRFFATAIVSVQASKPCIKTMEGEKRMKYPRWQEVPRPTLYYFTSVLIWKWHTYQIPTISEAIVLLKAKHETYCDETPIYYTIYTKYYIYTIYHIESKGKRRRKESRMKQFALDATPCCTSPDLASTIPPCYFSYIALLLLLYRPAWHL